MRRPIVPGLEIAFSGTVEDVRDNGICWWARLAVSLTDTQGAVRTQSRVLIALPREDGPQPWRLRGNDFPVPAWDLSDPQGEAA